HFHMSWEQSNDSLIWEVLLQHGITGVRDMGGDLRVLKRMKRKIHEDPGSGPEIFGSGPIIDGNPPVMYDFTMPVDSLTNIKELLDSLVIQGSDFFKTYSLLQEAELAQIAHYSKANHIPFAGHLSEYASPERSIELGQKSIEHLNRLDDIWRDDPSRLKKIAALMVQHGTWWCPTLIVYYLKAHLNESSIANTAYEGFIHPTLKQEWQNSRDARMNDYDSTDWQEVRHKFKEQQELVAFILQQGVNLLVGSDFAGMPYVYPGIGFHEELRQLQAAGISSSQLLEASTIQAARYLSIDDQFGSIEAGKYADMIILEQNPLRDIRNVRAVHQVYRKGHLVAGQ
ncbi:MAG: amidohydrolase family protein, partial [Cyclobacteriaceae bacterium]|nr:amidohydrolase family protein [Cyclobacteriaceae bacterium]